jgi:3',5'-cyclic AMP phosphodiesterase CpdA
VFDGCRLVLVVLVVLAALAAPVSAAQDAFQPRGEFRIVVFGDFNGPYGSLTYPAAVSRTVQAITTLWLPDLVLLPGDLVAGQRASLPEERFPAMWLAFDAAVAAPLRAAGIAYLATMGNHDASSLRHADGAYAFEREREAASAYWRDARHHHLADLGDARDLPFHAALRQGPVFVAVIDASSATVTAEARSWLGDALASPAARDAAVRLVMGHLPLVAVAVDKDRPGEVVAEPEALLGRLVDGRVDTYISGHHAAYFPGRIGELELLFAGGVGGRRLIGSDEPGRSAVTILDLWFSPLQVRISTVDPTTMAPIIPDTLPGAIPSRLGPVVRSERGATRP